MATETAQAPAAVQALLQAEAGTLAELAAQWRQRRPAALLTVARGSSDHAASHLAYLVMSRLGLPVASLPMSVVTVHQAPLAVKGLVALALSQSGRSPDLLATMQALRQAGAHTAAWVNDPDSPLALACDHAMPLHAAPELSVAATKSCIAQCAAGVALVAAWAEDAALKAALGRLPDALQAALALDWQAAWPVLQRARGLYVLGRGPAWAVAQEAALKLKEVCGLHAEACSTAELRHGPLALVGPDFPVLVLAPAGATQAEALRTAADLHARGAPVLLASPQAVPGTVALPLATPRHDALDAVALLPAIYRCVEGLARARGLDPDRPRHLSKVTLTQ